MSEMRANEMQKTLLDGVILPSGIEISYEYDEPSESFYYVKENPIQPARRFKNGILTA